MSSAIAGDTSELSAADHKAAVARWFDAIAAEWARRPFPGGLALEGLLACAPGASILDAGCGAGTLSLPLACRGYRLHGLDLSPAMIAEARRAADEQGITPEQARFEVGDIEQLPLPDRSCDGIICAAVLDFTPHPGVALREFHRVLKDSGRLLLIMLGAYSPVRRDPGHERWRRFLPEPPPTIPLNDILPWETEALLGALGWRIVEQRPFVGPSFRGTAQPYTAEQLAQLPDRILQQTAATIWQFVAAKE